MGYSAIHHLWNLVNLNTWEPKISKKYEWMRVTSASYPQKSYRHMTLCCPRRRKKEIQELWDTSLLSNLVNLNTWEPKISKLCWRLCAIFWRSLVLNRMHSMLNFLLCMLKFVKKITSIQSTCCT